MKQFIMSALILTLAVGTAQAQTTAPENKKGHKREHAQAYQSLNLTADQQARLRSVRENFEKQSAELRKQDQITVAEMKTRRARLHREYREQMRSILTAEQKAQLEKSRRDARFDRKGARSGIQGAKGKGGRMEARLDLTSEQQARMSGLRSEFKTKAEAIRGNASLSEEQKKTEFRALRKAQKEQFQSLLTPEQKEKLKAARKQRSAGNTK